MKRTEYTVTVVDEMGTVIGRRTTYAHNSANARGLDILRDSGGAERTSRPAWDDTRTVCRSTWVLARDGRHVTVTVAPTVDHPDTPVPHDEREDYCADCNDAPCMCGERD